MKAIDFAYERPQGVDEVCEMLTANPEARILAGGQTLIPMLAMRLSRPTLLVDVGRIEALKGIEVQENGIRVGSAVVQNDAHRSDTIRREVPLLFKALGHVGHPPTRHRGTVGGSLAHADPSAEIALTAAILGAEIVFRTSEGEERFEPEDYFIGPTLTTAPASGCLTEVIFPRRPEGRVGTGFHEIASRRSDYAFASAAAQVVLDEEGRCASMALGVGSVGDIPERRATEGAEGLELTDDEIAGLVEASLDGLETVDDLHASATYRRRAAGELARRAIREARDEAKRGTS